MEPWLAPNPPTPPTPLLAPSTCMAGGKMDGRHRHRPDCNSCLAARLEAATVCIPPWTLTWAWTITRPGGFWKDSKPGRNARPRQADPTAHHRSFADANHGHVQDAFADDCLLPATHAHSHVVESVVGR